MEITYLNGIKFDHSFEIIDLNDAVCEKFYVLLGVDILLKLGIYLSGVAYCWADDSTTELKKLKNINYDNDNAYDLANADYGS
ncbi:hypothetical protein [Parasitella parasitica]|uniref:Uncharacterized protein n=1 Tax=Parasitella parasitica TaxID=35722 RepID=A0A0B7N1H4_9FUNG|nr:hypothetical protein [Parasitella parasitica]